MKQLTKREIFWHDHVKTFLESGIAQADYCRKHGLNQKSFSVRKSQYLKIQKNGPNNSFVPINKPDKQISLTLANGIQIMLDQTTDPEWIAKLISSVEIGHARH